MDDAPSVDRLCVDSLGLSAPGGECSFVRMDVPDFQIAALLIVRQLLIDVIPSGRGGPNFDNQGKRLRVRIETSGLLEKCLHDWGGNHGDVRDVVGVGGPPQPS